MGKIGKETRREYHLSRIRAILAIMAVVSIGVFALNLRKDLGYDSIGILQIFLFCLVSIGGIIGFQIANDRQKTFSEQVQVQTAQMQVQANQGFNDRLGRGVEFLTKDDVVMRCVGIRVLVDLINSSNEAQKSFVANIIYDFFRGKTKIQYEDDEPLPVPEKDSCQDVQNALDFLINLTLEERERLLQDRLVVNCLDFSYLDFSHLSIINKTVENVDFSSSHIDGFVAVGANFENVNFFGAKIENSCFRHGSIVDSKFAFSAVRGSEFLNIAIEGADFSDIEIINTEFNLVRFIGGRFWGKNKIKVSSQDGLPKFICTELRYTEFDFSDKIYPDAFFNLCYYAEGQRPSILDKSREYELTMGGGNIDGVGFFVESNERWSGKSVREWVAVELATIKLEIAEDRRATIAHPIDASAEDIIEADKKVSAAEKELQAAQERLKKFQTP